MPRIITTHPCTGDSAPRFSLAKWKSQLNDNLGPFDQVSYDLENGCGAIPLEKFLANDFADDDPDYEEFQSDSDAESLTEQDASRPVDLAKESPSKDASLATLYQSCQRITGTLGALNFEILEEDPKHFRCILTVLGLYNTYRSYKTESTFTKRIDAKEEAARMAIQMGVLDFIKTGESELQRTKRVEHLARGIDKDAIDDGQKSRQSGILTRGLDPSIASIEECCKEWRAGKVRAEWVLYKSKLFGAVLRIALTPHALRIYSTEPIYPTFQEAQVACANVALDEGVLEYIKHGNGQKQPEKVIQYSHDRQDDIPHQLHDKPTRPQCSLQEFFETLPKPFPEPVGDKTASEILAQNWVNSKIASARVPHLKSSFYWTSSSSHSGLAGCLLRIERLDQVKSYLVDPLFSRRADAKAAVCLLAMSQGLGAYIHSLSNEIDKIFPPEHKMLAAQRIIPTLISRCQKFRAGNRPKFEYTSENMGHGCTIAVDLSTSAEDPDMREYTVQPVYRSKADAKLAVVYFAAKSGIIDLLQYSGPPPAGQRTYWDSLMSPTAPETTKRKSPAESIPAERPRKKRRKGNQEGIQTPQTPESVEQGEILEEEHTAAPSTSTSEKPKDFDVSRRKAEGKDPASGNRSLSNHSKRKRVKKPKPPPPPPPSSISNPLSSRPAPPYRHHPPYELHYPPPLPAYAHLYYHPRHHGSGQWPSDHPPHPYHHPPPSHYPPYYSMPPPSTMAMAESPLSRHPEPNYSPDLRRRAE